MVRVAVVALAAGSVAACSSDSTRFGEDPFSNPFSSSSSSPSASAAPHAQNDIPTGSVRAAPSSRVERSPLGSPSSAQSKPMYGYGGSSGASGGSYQSSRVEPRSTGSIGAPRPSPMASSDANWSSSGGTMVTLGRGETVNSVSQRYGVPASAVMRANGLTSATGVGEGRQLLIPTYSASAGGYRAASAAPHVSEPKAFGSNSSAPLRPIQPAPRAVAVVSTPAKPKMQFVQGAQPKAEEIKTARAEPVAKPAARPVAPAHSEQAFAAQPVKPAAAPASSGDDNVKTAALKVDPAPSAAPVSDGPTFRWPARGRVISAYGSKTSGASNDGVNIAMPEGTAVKASDDGVVAYSGSELKGFGNLVLIRHSNGWVTAYAHNSAIEVKRGETVRRGQVIAKSGSTGNVTSPQLHFEVRKGATTVDPMKHLPDA